MRVVPNVATALLFVGFGWSQPARAQTTVELANYVAGLRTVDVTVGPDRSTHPFLLDTGAGFTLVTPDVAKAAGCDPFGRLTGFRSSGERVDLRRCAAIQLSLAGVSVTSEVAVFDLMTLLGNAPVVGGLISLGTFALQPFTLDLGSNRLTLETAESLERRTEGMSVLTARLSSQAGGAAVDLFLALDADPGPVWFELDSGNTGPVLISPHAADQLGLTGVLDTEHPRPVTLSLLGLGDVSVGAVMSDRIYDGLLSAAVLEQLIVTVDLVGPRAWARRR